MRKSSPSIEGAGSYASCKCLIFALCHPIRIRGLFLEGNSVSTWYAKVIPARTGSSSKLQALAFDRYTSMQCGVHTDYSFMNAFKYARKKLILYAGTDRAHLKQPFVARGLGCQAKAKAMALRWRVPTPPYLYPISNFPHPPLQPCHHRLSPLPPPLRISNLLTNLIFHDQPTPSDLLLHPCLDLLSET